MTEEKLRITCLVTGESPELLHWESRDVTLLDEEKNDGVGDVSWQRIK